MLETLATGLVAGIGLYSLVGLLFALFFVSRGVNRVDPAAREGTWGFRLLILPGTAALWPILVRQLLSGAPPRERNAHRDLAAEPTPQPASRDAATNRPSADERVEGGEGG